MGRVIIGVDPHKLSATIEVLDGRESVLGGGRFGTDRDGYRQMLTVGRRWPDRVWAVKGCNGIGRHVAQRLVADGETVLDVPAKLSARRTRSRDTDRTYLDRSARRSRGAPRRRSHAERTRRHVRMLFSRGWRSRTGRRGTRRNRSPAS